MKTKLTLFVTVLAAALFLGGCVSTPKEPPVPHAVEWNSHWYAVFPGPLHWRPAKATSEELGGHLANIENAQENEFVLGLIRDKKPHHEAGWWTGGNCIEEDGVWRWLGENGATKGPLLRYLNWTDGHPHQHAGDWDYFLIRPDGKWNVHGAIGSGYIVEWE